MLLANVYVPTDTEYDKQNYLEYTSIPQVMTEEADRGQQNLLWVKLFILCIAYDFKTIIDGFT